MTTPQEGLSVPKRPANPPAAQQKRAKLAKALRANLARRKRPAPASDTPVGG